jgi:hypothetical protein
MDIADAIAALPILPTAFGNVPVINYTDGAGMLEENLVMTAVSEVVPEPGAFVMNAGLNDAWYNPFTDGQGFFITVFPDIGLVNLAWFTYDTELPADDATANLGSPGHRWLTAIGSYDGDQAVHGHIEPVGSDAYAVTLVESADYGDEVVSATTLGTINATTLSGPSHTIGLTADPNTGAVEPFYVPHTMTLITCP